ncbi:hypothetical protein GCM10010331_48960 [Streptomyces xanthochromogenes]|uniref:hypothetical protein n=1 Tax=Streptomyces xanthochromogenes TaxID=67384 RepID=UPI0016780136|nr:hypothetical protein [Streptomyces xanthochromogenes]GHB55342.1 hypothetical protein GCM10010331_48960 [Streptomyces xanthochromogenes]
MQAARRLSKRLGRRGSILAAFGIFESFYGFGAATDPRYGVVRGVGVLTNLLPMEWWGALWMVAGFLALVFAFEPRPRWDRWGFAAATLPMSLWSGANFVAWISGSFSQAWTSGVTWGVFVYIAIRINGWPEYGLRGGGHGR